MKERQVEGIIPEEFGQSFLNGAFSNIYQQTSDEFKQLVTFEQIIELGESFNLGVKKYSLEMTNRLFFGVEQINSLITIMFMKIKDMHTI